MELYENVNDHSLDAIISWTNNSNNSFIVWDVPRFCTRILPKSVEFGKNFSEFVSELRHHGFLRIGCRPWLLKRMVPSKAWNDKFGAKLKAKRDKAKAKKARAKVVRLLENLQI
ncbi:hypothetical protein Bca52824_046297 [Brassica carinata]|uniref:HSF-type DNA-binding domain-containing protein n=1 Tax=Brassica carinata TaxID=52824 RepID=A0A8X7RF30_BRACI|nr:hypothetical protein Bca52824_046297 [Brassica carinata]